LSPSRPRPQLLRLPTTESRRRWPPARPLEAWWAAGGQRSKRGKGSKAERRKSRGGRAACGG
jgi:hypothetical protein